MLVNFVYVYPFNQTYVKKYHILETQTHTYMWMGKFKPTFCNFSKFRAKLTLGSGIEVNSNIGLVHICFGNNTNLFKINFI